MNLDTIGDFSVKDDSLRLDNAVFKKLGKVGKLNKSYFTTGDKAKDKNDYIVYDKKTGILSYDADGSGRRQGGRVRQAGQEPEADLRRLLHDLISRYMDASGYRTWGIHLPS